MRRLPDSRPPLAFALALAFGACAGPPSAALPGGPPAAPHAERSRTLAGKYIKHVVIVVQENRTLDNLFHGYPGAATAAFGYTHTGVKVRLRPGSLRGTDILHGWLEGVRSFDRGRMDGFDLNPLLTGAPAGRYAYQYVPRSLVQPYWDMANRYVLADHMFPTIFGPSFTGHLSLIASTTNVAPDRFVIDDPNGLPWGCDAPAGTTTQTLSPNGAAAGPFPCFTQFRSIAETLDAAHVSWKYYAPAIVAGSTGEIWSEFDAIAYVRHGPDWNRNVVSPETTVLRDAAAGRLPGVSWVVPTMPNSDHVSTDWAHGPQWVASIVNAIGKGPQWKSTAIVVVWDDSGGWYDSVPPPQVDARGLGIRVPCLIVSPYAKAHYVSHTQYEFGSILRFVEETFGLPPLGTAAQGYTDARANSLTDSFDFGKPPRAFTPIASALSPQDFLAQPPSHEAPDEQ